MWHYNGRRFSTDTIKKYYRRMNLYKIWYLLVVVCIMKVLLINCFVQIVLFTYSPCSNLHRPQSPCYSFENSFFPTLKTVMCCFIHFLISMGVGYIFRQSPQQLEHLYIKTVVFVGKISSLLLKSTSWVTMLCLKTFFTLKLYIPFIAFLLQSAAPDVCVMCKPKLLANF